MHRSLFHKRFKKNRTV